MKRHRSLYYLFPGQARGARERRRRNRILSVIIGVVASALCGGLIYFLYQLSSSAGE